MQGEIDFRRTYSATHARLTLPGIHNIPRWLSKMENNSASAVSLKIVLANSGH